MLSSFVKIEMCITLPLVIFQTFLEKLTSWADLAEIRDWVRAPSGWSLDATFLEFCPRARGLDLEESLDLEKHGT